MKTPWTKPPWKLALGVAVVAVIAKVVTSRKAAWQGLTEAEVREKLDSRLPARMPDEKRADVADKVVTAMKKRGALHPGEDEQSVTMDGGAEDPGDEGPTADDDGGASEDTMSG